MLSSPPPPSPPPPHSRFGAYELLDRIAVGGMAEVFRALEPRTVGEPRTIVIKRLLPSLAAEPGSHNLLQEEARLGGRVRHENVVQVLGYGDENAQPYLAMEYVRGLDLWRFSRWLTRTGTKLDVAIALFIVCELLEGLHAIHEARDAHGQPLGIVHRDVSPSNVLLSMTGAVKVGDLGIARALLSQHLRQPAIGERAKGKLGYLAPEQVRGRDADRRADVFAAGVIAAELLMGRPLFAGGSELAVLLAIRDAQIHPFLEFAQSLPSGLANVIVQSLSPDPVKRTASARELAASLRKFQADSIAALRRELGDLVTQAVASTETPVAPEPITPVGGTAQRLDVADIATPVASSATAWDAPSTAQFPVLKYTVQASSGASLGEMPYAQVVEAVATGKLGPQDRVRMGSEPYRTVDEITELRRHLPPMTHTSSLELTGEPAHPDEKEPLVDGGIINVLGRSTLRRDTGLWLCELGGVRKEIYVKNGTPEFVTSNLAKELLGEYLVAHGHIARGELDMALAVMPRFEGRLGDTLVALGLVEPVHLFRHIAAQVRDKLLELFTWPAGTAAFYRGVPPPESGFPLDLDPWQILDEGIRRRFEATLNDGLPGRLHAKIARVEPPPAHVRAAELPSLLKRFLRMLNEPRALREVTAKLSDERDPQRGERLAVLLLRVGAIQWA